MLLVERREVNRARRCTGGAFEGADQLVEAGIKAILSYAPITINVTQDVCVQYIDPVIHLQRMTYYLT